MAKAQSASLSSTLGAHISLKDNRKYSPYDGLRFPFCDEDTKYEKLAKIGQGTFGYVLILLLHYNIVCTFYQCKLVNIKSIFCIELSFTFIFIALDTVFFARIATTIVLAV